MLTTIIIGFLIFCAIIVFYVIAIYNQLVTLKNRYANSFAQIEVQLKRRYDLIPNLVETAKGYMKHERETLEAVTNARNAAAAGLAAVLKDPANAKAMADLGSAEKSLGAALTNFNMVAEAYPDLKADQSMLQVGEELTSTENRVSFSRQAFNDAVTAYNIYRQSFPATIFATIFGHPSDAGLLEFADSEAIQDAPQVSF